MTSSGVSMDYETILAAVSIHEVDRARLVADGPDVVIELRASRIEECPHDLVALEVDPLGEVLAEAIDIGQPLRNGAWHPLRAPIVVDPETVTARAMLLDQAMIDAGSELGGLMAEVLGADIEKVRALYAHASSRNEAIVSFLSIPADDERAGRTLIPRIILP